MLHNITRQEKIIVMLAVMSGMFLVALDQTIIATALSAITKEFDSFSSLGFIVTAYLLTSTVSVPIAGKLSDMYGRRPILMTGVVVFTIGSLLSGMAETINWLVASRALQGIGGGIIMANAFTIIGDLFSPRERSRWQGIIGAVFGISSVIGPLLGGWLTDNQYIFGLVTDWRWTFYINVPIGIIVAGIIFKYCPQIKHDAVHKPDYLGALWITVGLAALVLAVDNTDLVFKSLIDQGINISVIKTALFSIFGLMIALFIHQERRAAQPIMPLRFFANRTFSLLTVITLLFGAAFLGAILYLTQFNQQVFSATASEAGLMLLPMMAGIMISSIGGGQIISRTGRYKPFIIAGLTLATISVATLTTLQPDSVYLQEAVIMFFAGIGLGMVMPVLTLGVQNEFGQKDLGAATSSVQLFRGLGSTIGTALMSGVLTAGIIGAMGEPSKIPYFETLRESSQGSAMLGEDITADTMLAINTQDAAIREGVTKSLTQLPIPQSVTQAKINELTSEQTAFRRDVVDAFTASLHRIFWLSAGLMLIGIILATQLPDKRLRDKQSIGGAAH